MCARMRIRINIIILCVWLSSMICVWIESRIGLNKYYIKLASQCTAHCWGTNLISHLWNIFYQIWWHCNNILHQHDKVNILSGLALLCESIRVEHNSGLQSLPNIYNPYFNTPLPLLLSKSTLYLKRWFLVIRSARESFNLLDHSDTWTT